MGFRRLLTGALIGFISCEAVAEWKYVDVSDGIFAFVDTDTISNVSEYGREQNRKFWSKQFVAEDLVQDGLAVGDYRMVLSWVNCQERTIGVKSVTAYKKQKNGSYKHDTETLPYVSMQEIIPGSIGDKVADLVCSY